MIEETRQALQGVRGGLIELYGAVGADPTAPQDVARRYGLNRNLTWKLSRVINASGPFASLNHLPGYQGLELAIGAFESAGASKEAVAQLRSALRKFTEVVQEHAGDREQLELTLESMGLLERETTSDSIRELAYRGNSGVWGVQARARVTTAFVSPSTHGPDKLDLVMVAGLVGFRRLRPTVEWLLFRQQMVDDKGASIGPEPEPLDPGAGGGVPQLLTEFCSPNMPALNTVNVQGGRESMLPSGEVGNRAAFDCYYGYCVRGVTGVRSPGNELGSFGVAITLPVENVVVDVIFHRSLALDQTLESLLYGFPHGGPDHPSAQLEVNRLPMIERPVELAGPPPALATPLVPAVTRIAERVYSRMGWDPREFRGLRLQVPYAPMGSQVVMHWPLPEKR
jgi:hypothetical protein